MERQNVSSSNLRSVGYDPSSETLEVQFKNGGIYQYYAVPESRYTSLMNASSKGGHFDTYIKKRSYRFKKVG